MKPEIMPIQAGRSCKSFITKFATMRLRNFYTGMAFPVSIKVAWIRKAFLAMRAFVWLFFRVSTAMGITVPFLQEPEIKEALLKVRHTHNKPAYKNLVIKNLQAEILKLDPQYVRTHSA